MKKIGVAFICLLAANMSFAAAVLHSEVLLPGSRVEKGDIALNDLYILNEHETLPILLPPQAEHAIPAKQKTVSQPKLAKQSLKVETKKELKPLPSTPSLKKDLHKKKVWSKQAKMRHLSPHGAARVSVALRHVIKNRQANKKAVSVKVVSHKKGRHLASSSSPKLKHQSAKS